MEMEIQTENPRIASLPPRVRSRCATRLCKGDSCLLSDYSVDIYERRTSGLFKMGRCSLELGTLENGMLLIAPGSMPPGI